MRLELIGIAFTEAMYRNRLETSQEGDDDI